MALSFLKKLLERFNEGQRNTQPRWYYNTVPSKRKIGIFTVDLSLQNEYTLIKKGGSMKGAL
jgi:hypothetical protein